MDRRERGRIAEAQQAAQSVATALLALSDAAVEPMREWLAGQRAYFLSQGYLPDEARAMAAATYMAIFGSSIARSESPPE